MDSWTVLFFTICCLVCASIYVQEWLRNGKNSFTLAWVQLSYGGGRVSIGPRDLTRYRKWVQHLRQAINEIINDRGSMEISKSQCQLLSSECLRLVQPTQPDSILKESYRAVRSALKLMQDCCSEKWLLKAVEFGNCREHFLEILHDLHRLSIVAKLVDFRVESLDKMPSAFRSTNISAEVEKQMFSARESDGTALRSRVVREIKHDHPDHYLADQLSEKPSLLAPPEIGRHVTQFDFAKTPIIYSGTGNIFVFRVTFCNKEFVIKMRCSKSEAEEDIQLRREADVMKRCRHPHAVGLLGYWEVTGTKGPKVPLLLMESMEYDLNEHIERNRKNHLWGSWLSFKSRGFPALDAISRVLPVAKAMRHLRRIGVVQTRGFPALDAISLVLPVAKAMWHLHRNGFVHRDLKPRNVLFTRVPGTQHLPDDISVKLADFGEAQKFEGSPVTSDQVGTTGYMDPDVRKRGVTVDLKKADVFSFGMVFGEVLTGLSPSEALDCTGNMLCEKLQNGERPLLPKDTPKFVKDIVDSCWASSPAERPSFEDICRKLQYTEFLLLNRFIV